jgi:hypothetical protein
MWKIGLSRVGKVRNEAAREKLREKMKISTPFFPQLFGVHVCDEGKVQRGEFGVSAWREGLKG